MTPLLPPSPFKVVPPSFEHGLVLLATLKRGGGGSRAQDHEPFVGEARWATVSSTFATGCRAEWPSGIKHPKVPLCRVEGSHFSHFIINNQHLH